ncbi:MAG: 3-hydroxyacyl-ACP dehydratase FabZ [Oligoflexales bacterium]
MTVVTLPLNRLDIQKWIPHREPMLMLDRITEYHSGHSITAEKIFYNEDPVAKGHFPDHPVFPGVLMIEGMAQASAVFGAFEMDGFKECLLAQVKSARFRRPVTPEETIVYQVEFKKRRQDFSWFFGRATVGSTTVAEVEFSALIR